MTELETRLVELLKASEAESIEREQRLIAAVDSLQQQVSSSAQQVQHLQIQVSSLSKQATTLANMLKELSES